MTKRNTLQKSIVSEVFDKMTNHPSAEMVYEAVCERYPGISRATVYRILAEAAEEGVIQRLKLCDANDRYDITLGKHYHVTCKNCGEVADVKLELDTDKIQTEAEGLMGFAVEDCHVEFFGLCEKCRKANSPEKQN
jgi:Fe2+ or Zn2+ uptake regulation protein